MPTPPITSCYSVSCMDPRERVVEARFSKIMHLVDAIENKIIVSESAKQILDQKKLYGSSRVELVVNFYRNARAGGGWSLDARDDLNTIKDNGLSVMAVYSTRHRQCAGIKVNRHLHDQDVAVMIVEDFDAVGLPLPHVFRAHLEVVTKHEEFEKEPMNLKALVAYALVHGTSRNFPQGIYSPERAARILGIDTLSEAKLKDLANQIRLSPKGLLIPVVELEDPALAH